MDVSSEMIAKDALTSAPEAALPFLPGVIGSSTRKTPRRADRRVCRCRRGQAGESSHSRWAANHLVSIPAYLSRISFPAMVPLAGRRDRWADDFSQSRPSPQRCARAWRGAAGVALGRAGSRRRSA
jgi:hypothetical protein